MRLCATLVAVALVAGTMLAPLPAGAATPVNPDVASRDVQSLQTAAAAFGDTAVSSGIAFTSAGPLALVAHAAARDSSGNNLGVTAEILSLPEPAHPWQDIATVDVVDRSMGAVSCTCQVSQVQLTGATDFLVQFAHADGIGGSVVSDVSGHWFPQPFAAPSGASSQVTNPVVVADTVFENVPTCVPFCAGSPDTVTAWRFDHAALAFKPAAQTTCDSAGCGQQLADQGTDSCMVSLSGSIEPSWLEAFNKKLQKAATSVPRFRLPATVALRYGLYANLAPTLEVGAATVCLTRVFSNLHLTEANPWDSGNLSFASTLSLKTGGDVTAGPWTYSVDDTAWNSENVPADQHRKTSWIPQFTVKTDVGLDYSMSSKSLQADVTLMELDFLSVKSFIKLAVQDSDVLSAEVGPTLALELQVSKQNLEDEIAKDIAEENSGDPAAGEQAAARDVADRAEADIADAGAAQGEGFFGMSQGEIEQRLATQAPNIESALQSAFNTWLSGIQAGSAEAAELAKFNVTADEVPGGAAEALQAEAAAGDAGGGKIITCIVAEIVGLGPEDPIADGICAAA